MSNNNTGSEEELGEAKESGEVQGIEGLGIYSFSCLGTITYNLYL